MWLLVGSRVGGRGSHAWREDIQQADHEQHGVHAGVVPCTGSSTPTTPRSRELSEVEPRLGQPWCLDVPWGQVQTGEQIEERPTRLDLAWHSSDPNTVGVDEFVRWARRAGVAHVRPAPMRVTF